MFITGGMGNLGHSVPQLWAGRECSLTSNIAPIAVFGGENMGCNLQPWNRSAFLERALSLRCRQGAGWCKRRTNGSKRTRITLVYWLVRSVPSVAIRWLFSTL
jgi:hypothetical protein